MINVLTEQNITVGFQVFFATINPRYSDPLPSIRYSDPSREISNRWLTVYDWKHLEGKMIDKPVPSAGLSGTTITVENLFFNCTSRRSTFRYPKEEAQKIADILVKYAIQYP